MSLRILRQIEGKLRFTTYGVMGHLLKFCNQDDRMSINGDEGMALETERRRCLEGEVNVGILHSSKVQLA